MEGAVAQVPSEDSPERDLTAELDQLRELVKLKDEELGRIEEARTLLYRALQEREAELAKLRSRGNWWRRQRRADKEATE